MCPFPMTKTTCSATLCTSLCASIMCKSKLVCVMYYPLVLLKYKTKVRKRERDGKSTMLAIAKNTSKKGASIIISE